MATLIKENIYLDLDYRFRDLVHYCHGGKHRDTGRLGAGKAAESPTSASADNRVTGPGLSMYSLKAHLQRQTSANKATPIPTRPHLLVPANPTP